MSHPVIIIGIGNPHRGDDAAGLLVARRLKNRKLAAEHAGKAIEVLEQSGEATALMQSWAGAHAVVLVDSISSGAAAGTVHRFDVRAKPVAAKVFGCSTHNFGVSEAIELARSLNRLPQHLVLYGIEGKSFQPGEALSAEVEKAMDAVIDRILDEIPDTTG